MSLWRHQMGTFSALVVLCAGNSPVAGEFTSQRPVTRSFDVFFDLRPNKRFSKQSWGWRFETPSRSSWRHCNGLTMCKIGGRPLVRRPLLLKKPSSKYNGRWAVWGVRTSAILNDFITLNWASIIHNRECNQSSTNNRKYSKNIKLTQIDPPLIFKESRICLFALKSH